MSWRLPNGAIEPAGQPTSRDPDRHPRRFRALPASAGPGRRTPGCRDGGSVRDKRRHHRGDPLRFVLQAESAHRDSAGPFLQRPMHDPPDHGTGSPPRGQPARTAPLPRSAPHDEVHLGGRREMNEVPATPFTHRLAQGRCIHEEIFAQRFGERGHVRLRHRDHEVDVVGGARLALAGAGERAAKEVADAHMLEGAGYRGGNGEDVGRAQPDAPGQGPNARSASSRP